MDRRNFLKVAGASGAAATMAPWQAATARPKKPRRIEPANPTAPMTLPFRGAKTALVIGAGLGGLSAALELAERGYAVKIREASDVIGGRLATRTMTTQAGTFNVEHGLHMWFHNYHNFRDIQKRLGIDDQFRPYDDVHFRFRDYKDEILKSEPPVYPLNLIALLERSPNFNFFSAFRMLRLLPAVAGYDHDTIYERLDNTTFENWAENRVSKKFYDIIMQPAASVTLNDPERVSAAEMILYMHLYFMGDPRAMNRTVCNVDHATGCINPWVRYLSDLGVRIETNSPVEGLRVQDGRVIGTTDDAADYDWVVMATSIPGLKTIFSRTTSSDFVSDAAVRSINERIAQLKVAQPYQVVRVWYDRQPSSDVSDVLETPQHKPINLLAQFHLLEEESRAWAEQTGGAIIEYHVYANDETASMTDAEILDHLRPVIHELMPELADATVLDYTVGRYHDFPSFEVGQGSIRPTAAYPAEVGLTNLTFAGDWLHTNYPSALMERAVSTGREAANHILLADGVRQAPMTVTSSQGPGII
ncbi:MAG: FAD-dependent oxidoreductase [Myxococcota bacterium]|nr:FAD-dependent oxidoreductase [Myxococcota bacterium]